jgi:hypothetical protein
LSRNSPSVQLQWSERRPSFACIGLIDLRHQCQSNIRDDDDKSARCRRREFRNEKCWPLVATRVNELSAQTGWQFICKRDSAPPERADTGVRQDRLSELKCLENRPEIVEVLETGIRNAKCAGASNFSATTASAGYSLRCSAGPPDRVG